MKAFAFFGAGDADYYESASLTIVFAKPPSPATKKKLEHGIPGPLSRERWTKRTLFVATDDHALVGKRSFTAFNAAIDAWLLACHAIAPIDFVLRAEDSEASTRFSQWHRDSMVGAVALVTNFAKRYDDAKTRAWAKTTLVEMMKAAGVALPAKLVPKKPTAKARAFDEDTVKAAILEGAIDPLLAQAAKSPFFSTLCSDAAALCVKETPEAGFAVLDRLVELDNGHAVIVENALWAVEAAGASTVARARLDRYWTLAVAKLPEWEPLRAYMERLAPALGREAPRKKRR